MKSQGPGPAMTPDQLSEQVKLDKLFSDVQDPSSPNFHKYLQGGEFDSMFPGLVSARKADSDWQRSLQEAFQKQYGSGPVTGVSIPPVMPLTGTANAPVSPPETPSPGLPANSPTSPAIQQLLSQINGMAKTTSKFGAAGPNLNGGENDPQSSLAANWADMF